MSWPSGVWKSEARDTKMEINFGSQIRSYVMVLNRTIKDHRTKKAIGDVDRVLEVTWAN
jgi:peptide chain release factor 2